MAPKKFSKTIKTDTARPLYEAIEAEFHALPLNEEAASAVSVWNAAYISNIFRKCAAFYGFKISISRSKEEFIDRGERCIKLLITKKPL